MPRPAKKRVRTAPPATQSYGHPEADLASRPEIGAQTHFKKAKPPATYRYDSSLAPELSWDGQNPGREDAEVALRGLTEEIAGLDLQVSSEPLSTDDQRRLAEQLETRKAKLQSLVGRLKALSGPFLNWTGKAERLSFEVPTMPLFVHERLSTRAILDTLKGHRRDKQDTFLDVLYACEERSLYDQVLRSYEHRDRWVNRMVLGDSMVVMNSLLHFENLGGQVQMIYIDPPYGVKFGSNFQPFIRKRDVAHNDDDDLTREPKMVQAYRDTWELGLHSYLTYLRDRLLLARDLLHSSGSVFVQISDENLHHVRELLDEVFGAENFCSVITYAKTTSTTGDDMSVVNDYVLWYFREKSRAKVRKLYKTKRPGEVGGTGYNKVRSPDGTLSPISEFEETGLPRGARICATDNLTSSRPPGDFPVEFQGKTWRPTKGYWKTGPEGMEELKKAGRVYAGRTTLGYIRFLDDFPCFEVNNIWTDTVGQNQFGAGGKVYAVQTANIAVQRCLLMTTDPGDLILDPTCGSGTTAYVAEQWGRRWITCDTSRVPLALARQRLLTGTFDYYELKDESRGPVGGFVYKRRQNQKGEEVGGIVPHITLKSIANNEPPAEEVVVDRPETVRNVVRVAGPFTVEATLPAAEGLDEEQETPGIQGEEHQTHVQRMIDVLRRAPVLRLSGNQTITLKQIRPPVKTLALSAEAVVDLATSKEEAVAIVFGPENGMITERFVREAWDEAGVKRYSRLFVIGFGIDPKAREFVDKATQIGIPAVYLQATMDLQMGDLLKNMRSSQIFSVCGLPDVRVSRKGGGKGKDQKTWQVALLGLDTFDPATMEPTHLKAEDVPAWFLDTDYNGLVFRVRQAFFPRTGAWENLKRALKVEFDETVWDHLAGTTSAPFLAGEHGRIAVKVIDPRGNELIAVKKLEG